MSIQKIHARQIFDSRGNPTIEVDLTTDKGTFRAAVPSGASTGAHEALELRDGDKSKYFGKGVQKAIDNVNNIIAPKLIGQDPTKQVELDNLMLQLDGTENKSKLGANAILGVSLALAKAGAAHKGVPLYKCVVYPTRIFVSFLFIFSAGTSPNWEERIPKNLYFQCHSSTSLMAVSMLVRILCQMHIVCASLTRHFWEQGNNLAFQEFMLVPVGATSFAEAMRMGAETYHHLKAVIAAKYGKDATNVGDEGGFAPNIGSAIEGLDLLVAAIEKGTPP